MPVVNRAFNLAYFPVPKNACTSIKLLFFELENGFQFRTFKSSGVTYHIHTIAQSLPFTKKMIENTAGLDRIAVIRDPIQRLVSAYRNRVIHHGEIRSAFSAKHPLPADLTEDPDLNTFVTYLDEYRKIPSIRHHTDPQTIFLGSDLSQFNFVYSIEKLAEMVEMLRQVTKRELVLPHVQTGGPKIGTDALSNESIDALRRFYKADYDALSAHYR